LSQFEFIRKEIFERNRVQKGTEEEYENGMNKYSRALTRIGAEKSVRTLNTEECYRGL
jgi:hypothetical protein